MLSPKKRRKGREELVEERKETDEGKTGADPG